MDSRARFRSRRLLRAGWTTKISVDERHLAAALSKHVRQVTDRRALALRRRGARDDDRSRLFIDIRELNVRTDDPIGLRERRARALGGNERRAVFGRIEL